MRFMVIIKANEQSERGEMPPPEMFEAMHKYNEELVNAGVLLAGEGLLPSDKGKRVHFALNGPVTVTDGPFAETKELIAGFWLLQCKSIEECLEWVKRIPSDGATTDGVVEIRQVASPEDFGDAISPELARAEEQLRARTEGSS
jgi:hypothetical protein